MRNYGRLDWHDLEAIAAALFDPSSLVADSEGVRLCRVGEPDIWATDGFADGAWQVRHADGRRDRWAPGTVFDPYMAKKIAHVEVEGSMPLRAHEGAVADDLAATIQAAIDDYINGGGP